MRPKAGE